MSNHNLFVLVSWAMALSTMSLFAGIESAEELRADRERVLESTRVIFNSDGCDAWHYRGPLPVTPERFLQERSAALSNSTVDTISFCPLSAGFGGFLHRTRVGHILAFDNSDFGPGINATPELFLWGTDPLTLVAEFCREHDMRVLFSLRMNDTHDGAHRPDKPHIHWSPLKENHPEWLIGSLTNRPPHCRRWQGGGWSAVNYTVPEIRDLAFRYCEEACRDFDIDGLELDFFRHLGYFPTVAQGGKASDEECAMMTELVRRIRAMTEQVSMERGRPLILAVRVPDHPDYARGVGLDVVEWMKQGLVDIVIGGGDFRLRDWGKSVELCHQYGVRFFAGFTDWRVRRKRDFIPGMHRQSSALYRAAAMNAWAAGVDGIYSFNEYNTRQAYLKEIGDPESLRFREKVYAVAVRTDDPERYLVGGSDYMERILVSPNHLKTLGTDQPLDIPLRISEPVQAAVEAGLKPRMTLLLQTGGRNLMPGQLAVTFNEEAMSMTRRDDQGWMTAALDPDQMRFGWNQVGVLLRGDARASDDPSAQAVMLRDLLVHVRYEPASAESAPDQ